MIKLYGYKKCSTCSKTEKFLEDQGLDYKYIDLTQSTPSKDDLRALHEKSGQAINKFFNSSGQAYRKLGLKDKKDHMTEEEIYALLATDGMLIKRPILELDDQVIIGRINIEKHFQ